MQCFVMPYNHMLAFEGIKSRLWDSNLDLVPTDRVSYHSTVAALTLQLKMRISKQHSSPHAWLLWPAFIFINHLYLGILGSSVWFPISEFPISEFPVPLTGFLPKTWIFHFLSWSRFFGRLKSPKLTNCCPPAVCTDQPKLFQTILQNFEQV
jgi:hypothetical protein